MRKAIATTGMAASSSVAIVLVGAALHQPLSSSSLWAMAFLWGLAFIAWTNAVSQESAADKARKKHEKMLADAWEQAVGRSEKRSAAGNN